MKRFDFGREIHVLRREYGFADQDGELLSLAVFVGERDFRDARSIFDGNGKQAEALAVRLREQFGGAAIQRGRGRAVRASNAERFAKVDLFGGDSAGLGLSHLSQLTEHQEKPGPCDRAIRFA